jgi:hypothetical protein
MYTHVFIIWKGCTVYTTTPSWVHSPGIRSGLRFCIGLRLSFFRMSRFPDIFYLNRTSGVSERVRSSGSSVFRRLLDEASVFPNELVFRLFGFVVLFRRVGPSTFLHSGVFRLFRSSDCLTFRLFPDVSEFSVAWTLLVGIDPSSGRH